MGYYAEADDFVIYDFEWKEGTAQETPDLVTHIHHIVPRLAVQPFPIVINTSDDSDLDRERRLRTLEIVHDELKAAANLGVPVAVINHLGPQNRVTHIPQMLNHHDRHCQNTKPSGRVAQAFVDPEDLLAVIPHLDQRVIVDQTTAEGQFSDTFGQRGFSSGNGSSGRSSGRSSGQSSGSGSFGGGGGGGGF